MWVVLRYFREHPWQRRALTLSLAALLGVGAAWIAWPRLRDLQVLRLLGSDDPLDRQRGISWALELAPHRPELVERLERRLDSAGDVEFATIVEVLNRLGRFDRPGRAGEQIDRWRAVSLAAASAQGQLLPLRLLLLNGLVRGGRDNAHVRTGLQLAAKDAEGEVRAASAVLAARLTDDRTLANFLDDGEPDVRAAACIDAALAGRKACTEKIAEIFASPKSDEELAAAAYALARLAPKQHGKAIAERIERTREDRNDALLERLFYVATLLDKDAAAPTVVKTLARAERSKEAPPTMALVAAGRLRLEAARPHVDAVAAAVLARDKDKLTVGDAQTLAAAVGAAHRLAAPPELFATCMERLWHPGTSLAMILCAEALGDAAGAARQPAREDAPFPRERVLGVLRGAAAYEGTPVPSAAAAAALFRLAPDQAEEALRTACESQTWLAGDYVAWNVARAGAHREEALRIAARLYGPGEYNDSVRSAGAVLLALLTRGTDHAGEVIRSTEGRLGAGRQNPFVAGSYQCALLILGRREFAGQVAELARAESFPKRRALTALVSAGEPAGLDVVLASERLDPARIDSFLTGRLMSRVYAAVMQAPPAFDLEAPAHVRYWQCRIWRDFYLIHRRAILDRMRS